MEQIFKLLDTKILPVSYKYYFGNKYTILWEIYPTFYFYAFKNRTDLGK